MAVAATSLAHSRRAVRSSLHQEDKISSAPAAAADALDKLLRFGALMLRAGNTALRTRERMEVMARRMGFDAVSVVLTLDSVTASVRRAGEWTTAVREIGPPGINAWRIGELDRLAASVEARLAPRELAASLGKIEFAPHLYSDALLAAAIGVASGAFAFLNGGAMPEVIAAAIGGGIGQGSRAWLSRRQLNQYGVAAVCALVASASYVVAAALAGLIGFGFAHHPAGFISSVLFLVPGFPLVAALFDLMQHQTVVAVTRLAYGVMILLVVAFGLSIVVALAGVDLSRPPPPELAYPLRLILRGVASFLAGCAFAMLFNNPARTVIAAGLLALAANELRLALHDSGMMLAPATFFGALAIGLLATLVDRRFDIPRIAMTVPPIIIMVPGLYAFEMIVLLQRGEMLNALQASASCGFVIGALAMGLAAARLISRR